MLIQYKNGIRMTTTHLVNVTHQDSRGQYLDAQYVKNSQTGKISAGRLLNTHAGSRPI